MKRAGSAAVAVLAATVVGGLLWLAMARKSGGRSAANGMAGGAAMDSPAHERAALEQLLLRKPRHGPIVLRLSQLDLAEGKPETARKRLEAYLRDMPDDAPALLELGRACYQAGDTECATASTSRVLELEPENPGALYNLGAIHANNGRKDLARRFWERAARVAPASESGRMAVAALGKL